MAKDTKEKILDASLELFAQNGYTGTNIKDIAGAVGLVKSAFYRHYDSKEAVWTAMIDHFSAYYAKRFASEENLPPVPESTDEFFDLTMRLLDFTVHDKKIVLMRKIILTEQFRDERIAALATEHFGAGLETIFTKLFDGMMKNGTLKNGDAAMLAFGFVSPISSLVHLCDREPEKEPEAMEKARSFVRHFIEEYGTK